jgi:hypothetical protein
MGWDGYGQCMPTNFPDGLLNLFVTEIGEPEQNMLRIVVAEGVRSPIAKLEIEGMDFGPGHSIDVTTDSRLFELSWAEYVAYAVRNERFWKPELGQPTMANHLEQRYDSAFLKFVFQTTFADDGFPGPLQHWTLNTHTHCVDVVSVNPPRIRLLGANDV